MAKIKLFSFILPFTVMRNGQPEYKGDLIISGKSVDRGNVSNEEAHYDTTLLSAKYNGTDILPVLEWLEEQPDVDLISIHAAVDNHVAKLFHDEYATVEA